MPSSSMNVVTFVYIAAAVTIKADFRNVFELVISYMKEFFTKLKCAD